MSKGNERNESLALYRNPDHFDRVYLYLEDVIKPESFIKIFWHIALITGFIMLVRFLIRVAAFYIGLN